MMTDIALFLAALVAGALNAVAGGGSFITFPTLVLVGSMGSVTANATSTVALFPASFASMAAYRHDLKKLTGIHLPSYFAISLLGGGLGALLLLWTPVRMFDLVVPWLLAFATTLFAFGKPLSAALAARFNPGRTTLLVAQFIIALYGGYFGGGMGFLILATLGLFGLRDLHQMNGLKTMVGGALNAVATLTFIIAGAVDWWVVAVMLPGGLIGGYGGAALAKRIPQNILRSFILTVAVCITVYFFVR